MTTSPIAPPPAGELVVFTTNWCPFCSILIHQLSKQQVPHTRVDIERDAEAAAFVRSVNGGNQTVPTVLFADGSTATNPSIDHVLTALSPAAEGAP